MQLSAKLLILSIGLIGLLVVGRAPTAAADDKIKGGFVAIKLIDAKVPDMDPLPLQRESDVFAKVYQMLKLSEENKQKGQLLDKELICETQTIQDDNSPKFDKKCVTPRWSPSDVVLKVELFDSDKPAPEPDKVGDVMIKVADLLLNRKLDSEEMFPIEGLEYPKYYLKAKIDIKRLD